MLTQLLQLLDGGQGRSLRSVLKSDLKVIGILFMLAIGLSVVITAFSLEPSIDSDLSDSQLVVF